jgi:hypothetical protein
MLKNLRTDHKIKTGILKWKTINVRNRKQPASTAMLPAMVVKKQPVSGLLNIIKIKIGAKNINIRTLICSRGMPARSASNIQNTITGPKREPAKINGDHE